VSEILVIREPDLFSSILIEQGSTVINFPTIKIETLDDFIELDKVLTELETFDGVFITSPNAAQPFLERLKQKQVQFGGKFYILGNRTDELLTSFDCQRFFSDEIKTASELLNAIPESELKGKKFLILRGNRSLRVIPEKLKNIAEVREVVVYKTLAPPDVEKQADEIKRKLRVRKIVAVCFFSPSGVDGFLEIFTDFSQNDTKVAVIGQTTARYAEEKQLRVDFVSSKPTAETYALELTSYLRKEI
jgi:uroporphyrinogen-III synthase